MSQEGECEHLHGPVYGVPKIRFAIYIILIYILIIVAIYSNYI